MGWSYKQIMSITEELSESRESTGTEILAERFWQGLSDSDRRRYRHMNYRQMYDDASKKVWDEYYSEPHYKIELGNWVRC